ncbi:MAG: ABC transporter permease, partial [Mycobacteriales bacterium]
MLRATLKSLLARKIRLILSGFAVVLGVMAVAGALILGSTLNKSVDGLFATAYENIDVQISGKTFVDASSQGGADMSQPVPAGVLEQTKSLPGVASAKGSVTEDGARVIGKDNKVITTSGPPRLGINWRGEDKHTKLRTGRGPTADSEVAINGPVASAGDFKVGDQISVLTKEPKKTFTVVGIYGAGGGKGSLGGEMQVAFTEPVAQKLMLGKEGVFSTVDLKAKSGVSQKQLRREVKDKVGGAYVVKTGDQANSDSADQLTSFVSLFRNVLLGFAAVALFVGIFLILNTFSIIVAQRTKELALFRAMGAARGQVIRSVMIEALVVGIIASTLGFVAGIGIAKLLLTVLSHQGGGAELFAGTFTIPASAIIASYAVGIIVTLIAAVIPAVRASRIPPVAALRDAELTQKPLTKLTVAGAIPFVLGVVLILIALFSGASAFVLLAGVLLTFIGVAMLAPVITRPAVGLIGRVFSWSLAGRLGRRNASRNPRRTAITASALMIGLALVTGVSVIASSLTASISKVVKQDIKAQLFISGDSFSGGQRPTFDPIVIEKARQIPGVTGAAASYGDFAKINGKVSFVLATDPRDLQRVSGVKATEGRLDTLGKGSVLVDDKYADDHHLSVGSKLDITTTNGGKRSYAVAAIYRHNRVSQGTVMSVEDAKQDFTSDKPNTGLVAVGQGTSVASVKRQVAALLKDNPEVSVQNQDEIAKQASKQVDQFLLVLYVLLGLAIVIAVLGIINTLALSILERTRELGLLRAVGLSRARTRRMITVESIVIAVFGSLLGLVVGCGLGALIVTALKDHGFDVLAFPWARMV